ncbi:MAG: HAD hydrolase family protein [Deltaproteobacteria bacterium]|nr:HAD hydrolase family protein [Deltaproteobacteria bacterium]
MREMITEALQEKIKPVRVLILDVDGVLTDGEIIIDDAGRETKHFNVRDGHGLIMLMRYGVEVVLLTGRTSQVVSHRALDLGIKEIYQGVFNKLTVFEEILRKKNISPAATAFVGDDVVDVPVLRRVGFSATVADASADLKNVVDYVTEQKGGRGAVREICEIILKAQGKWPEVAARYELI